MHFNFPFSEVQIVWTLTFAALLVLLVVLMGRDRVSRYPWFTASIILTTLRMLASRLLFGKLAQLTASEIFLTFADIGAVISLLVVVEMARRAFARASRTAWIAWTLVLLAAGGTVAALWGAWPPAASLFARSTLSDLRLMQLVAQRADLLADLLIIELCVLMAFAGRRYGAGWRSHTQQIVVGLSTASLMQVGVRAAWQAITSVVPKSQEEYTRLTGLQDKLFSAENIVSLLVIVWWIVCLWIDEPGSTASNAGSVDAQYVEALPAEAGDTAPKVPEAGNEHPAI